MESVTVIEENLEEVEAALQALLEQYPSKNDAAKALGVNRIFLWKMINRHRPISDTVLNAIGYERKVTRINRYFKRKA